MDKVNPYNTIVYSNKKKRKTNKSYNMDQSLKLYAKRKKSNIPKATYYIISFIRNVQKRQIYRDKH